MGEGVWFGGHPAWPCRCAALRPPAWGARMIQGPQFSAPFVASSVTLGIDLGLWGRGGHTLTRPCLVAFFDVQCPVSQALARDGLAKSRHVVHLRGLQCVSLSTVDSLDPTQHMGTSQDHPPTHRPRLSAVVMIMTHLRVTFMVSCKTRTKAVLRDYRGSWWQILVTLCNSTH